ncbi:MAG: hypothetical protein JW995_04625 [Melioribacteraceae bacterium]|nr:hypothetical protein [Melioribacteraceae bacterium]
MKKSANQFVHTIAFVFMLFSGVSCSGSHTKHIGVHFGGECEPVHNQSDQSEKYKFKSKYEGDYVKWKVYVEDDSLIKLYKDGEQIEENELYKYEDYILKCIKAIESDYNEIDDELAELRHEIREITPHRNRHKIILDDFNFDFDFDFDSEALAESMVHLEDALSKLDIQIEFDEDDFNWDDEDWDWNGIDFDSGDDNIHIKFDSDKLRKNMKKLQRELDKINKIDIDINMNGFTEGMEQFAESMKDFEIDMSGLKENMKDLKVELKKLKNFIHETNDELVEDGYLENSDDDYNLVFDVDEMYVNNKKLPSGLHKKYLEIYRRHFGKDPKGTLRFND